VDASAERHSVVEVPQVQAGQTLAVLDEAVQVVLRLDEAQHPTTAGLARTPRAAIGHAVARQADPNHHQVPAPEAEDHSSAVAVAEAEERQQPQRGRRRISHG
jgi:hypothetical protein